MRILNFGSLNIDKVYNVKDFVRPGETVLALEYQEFPGGKGLNQSVALAKAGAETYHAGIIGCDGAGLKAALDAAGVHTELLKELPEPSGHAIIEINEEGQNRIIVNSGTNARIDEDYILQVLALFCRDDILLIQNEISGMASIMEHACEKGMKIILNPSPVNEALFTYPLDKVDIFVLNETEGLALAGMQTGTPEDILRRLREKYQNAEFVLTLGEQGACYLGKDTCPDICYQSAFITKTVDTTAAGDTFCGYFIRAYAEGKTPGEALYMAAKASALAVSRHGASPSIPLAEEVRALTNFAEAFQ
ncbi:MAG: ribokinase [Marvinbryantia sp.]|uniref:ribokinase n=2 Tax=Marvinbryantia sp. TaxID=2496532 RepID=UPI0025E02338|nr:ribokinase [uncultured Marvinbryantia sp.]